MQPGYRIQERNTGLVDCVLSLSWNPNHHDLIRVPLRTVLPANLSGSQHFNTSLYICFVVGVDSMRQHPYLTCLPLQIAGSTASNMQQRTRVPGFIITSIARAPTKEPSVQAKECLINTMANLQDYQAGIQKPSATRTLKQETKKVRHRMAQVELWIVSLCRIHSNFVALAL